MPSKARALPEPEPEESDEDGEEELLLDEDEDKVELLSLENDILQMTYFSRRGRRVLSNKNI